MTQLPNKFADPKFLVGMPVVIKIADQYPHRAVVVHLDHLGIWLQSDDLSRLLMAGFQGEAADFQSPALFVPTHRIEWMTTPANR